MSKKHYFILSSAQDTDRMSELREKAKEYYGAKEYSDVLQNSEYLKNARKTIPQEDCKVNASLLLLSVSLFAMSLCDSIYVSNKWENDHYCQVCHMLAFSHGLDIVYEPV